MESENSLPFSQKTCTSPNPERDESSIRPTTLFPYDVFKCCPALYDEVNPSLWFPHQNFVRIVRKITGNKEIYNYAH